MDDKRGTAGKTRATLIDVAREAGVSRATASLVLRNSPLVAAETRTRVEAAMAELGYVANLAAARLRANQSRIIGVVIPNLVNPFFADFLSGIEAVANEAGFAVLLANSHENSEHQLDLITRMREHGVDGLLICPADGTRTGTLSQAQILRMPIVQVLRHIRADLDYVGPDYAGGVEAAVDHLVRLGHRNIVFAVHRATHSAYVERLSGFEAASIRNGLANVSLLHMPDAVADLPATASELLSLPGRPTATLCFNDLIAYGLSAGMSDLGIVVGRDHALIGFDDVMNSEIARPRLTSVATHPRQIGETAARRMLSRLDNRLELPQATITEIDLVIRQSCGANPRQAAVIARQSAT